MITIQARRGLAPAALIAIALTIAGRAQAAPPTPQPEKTLLGIKLLSRFGSVLGKFGQPNEIQIGSPVSPSQGQPMQGSGAGAARPGGFPGAGFPGGGYPGGGYPGGGRPGGFPGAGYPGGGYPGAGGRGGLPGFGGGGKDGGTDIEGGGSGGRPGGFPGAGFPGGGYPGGGYPGGGFPGAGFPGGAAGGAQQAEGSETTWWYHYPKDGVHFAFLFNTKGEVIQIQAYGYAPKGNHPRPQTLKGITLGSSLGDIVRRYGFSTDGEHAGQNVTLRYGGRDRLAFQLISNKVVGITLAVVR